MIQSRKNLLRKLIREEELSPTEANILGDTIYVNPNFPFKYVIRGDKYLGSRFYSEDMQNIAPIRSTTGNSIAKLNAGTERELKAYKAIEKEAYDLGIHSPSTNKTLCNVYDATRKKFRRALVLEKIEGPTVRSFLRASKKETRKRVSKKIKHSKKKLRSRFHIDDDCHDENIMIENKTGKIFFIDPEYWETHKDNKTPVGQFYTDGGKTQ